ncbi:hypothetical protein Salat_0285000 [Sesamum alatum]|uniref:Pectinesterase inhibitor domain-containing protein n=1 Tax=Sesamum alatum TaxID=300844 RepID=A0AAE1Z176_9LAMI|nr:hypothetical protein Salat_0285000 [Sesamum alatum]
MAILRSVTILIAFSVLCCFLTSPPPLLSATAAAADRTELATEVCRNTTNFAFCRDAIYSDPRAPDADRYVLSYIAFGKAYSNATDTRDYIAYKIKSGGGKPEILRGLKKCLGHYEEAVRILAEMLGNLDSETFSGLDKLSVEVEGLPRACEKRFGGRSPITTRNDNLIKLANICYVVAKLYEYH